MRNFYDIRVLKDKVDQKITLNWLRWISLQVMFTTPPKTIFWFILFLPAAITNWPVIPFDFMTHLTGLSDLRTKVKFLGRGFCSSSGDSSRTTSLAFTNSFSPAVDLLTNFSLRSMTWTSFGRSPAASLW